MKPFPIRPTSRAGLRLLVSVGLAALTTSGCHHNPSPTSAPTPTGVVTNTTKPVVQPAGPPPLPETPKEGVKAIYLTGWTAGTHKSFTNLVALADRTEINAMVIDVKDDGDVTYDVDVPLVKEVHANLHMIKDIDKTLAVLNAHHIYSIARIACMRDTPLAKRIRNLQSMARTAVSGTTAPDTTG